MKKIGIAGVGIVGGALNNFLKDYNCYLYDPEKNHGNVDGLNKCDLIFVCVPTPYGEQGFDLSYVIDVIDKLNESKIIVIKSTILPGTTEFLQSNYPEHYFLFNPEFLTENYAEYDMKNPDKQIVGYTEKSEEYALYVLNLLPDCDYKRTIKSTEAEMIKYFQNCFFSVKVIFANQIYDLCQKLNIDYDIIKDSVIQSNMIANSHLEIFHKGFRGYSGKCLPKDIKSLIDLGEKLDVNLDLLKKADDLNEQLLGDI
jgi:UDPglucose 6-dehydrogenase